MDKYAKKLKEENLLYDVTGSEKPEHIEAVKETNRQLWNEFGKED